MPPGAIQFPIPVSRPQFDFSKTTAPSLRDVFPEPKPKDTRTLAQKILEARFELIPHATAETIAIADRLLVEYTGLEERITAFLAEQREAKLKRLEAARADLWSECRKLEDTNRAARNEVSSLNNRLNARSSELVAARQMVAEANNPGFDSQFPNASEVAEWQAKRAGARTELATVETQHQNLQRELAAARAAHTEAAREFTERVEALRALDSELIEYRNKT